MWVYDFLSKTNLFKNYSHKVLFINSLGIVIPFIGISLYILIVSDQNLDVINMLSAVLIFSLVGFIVSTWLQSKLSAPITMAQNELEKYINTNETPNVPIHYKDEMGMILKDIQKKALSINKLVTEKNDFTAMLSHDLRSPIVSIIGLIKLIKEKPESEQSGYFCDKIEEFGYHQLNLMKSIISLLNEENQREEVPNKTDVNLSKMLAQSLSQFELTLQNKQVAISQNVPPHLTVKVEPYSFSQVMTNLIHNAIKFSRKGDRIEVMAHNGGDNVKISVKDQGIGFALDNPGILFERFTPERKRGTQGEPTNGLGLYLSKKIIEKHDGEISAESPGNNKGATFKVKIPCK